MMAGSSDNKKDSAGRRLGVKKFGNARAFKNDILIR
jgi:ribosomal protein L27